MPIFKTRKKRDSHSDSASVGSHDVDQRSVSSSSGDRQPQQLQQHVSPSRAPVHGAQQAAGTFAGAAGAAGAAAGSAGGAVAGLFPGHANNGAPGHARNPSNTSSGPSGHTRNASNGVPVPGAYANSPGSADPAGAATPHSPGPHGSSAAPKSPPGKLNSPFAAQNSQFRSPSSLSSPNASPANRYGGQGESYTSPLLQPSDTPWAEYQIQRAVPSPRFGHSANYITARDGELFIMGGIRDMDILNDLWVIDTNTLTGYQLVTGGAKVGPRVGHAALVLGNAHVVFGGDTKLEETDPLDDNLYLLNTSSLRWTVAQPQGPRPTGRYGHSLSSINARVYVFGGQVDEEFFDDMWAFDLTTWRSSTAHWERIHPATPPPPPRTNHTVVTWQDKLYLFGGANGDLWYSDTWVFDPATRRWDQLECSGYVPAPCQGHAATIIGDVMYVFGGMSSQGLLIDQLFALKLTTLKWYTFQNLGPGPSPRSGHSLTAFAGDKILVWGGTDQGNSAYVLDVSRINYPDEPATPRPALQGGSASTAPSSGAGSSGPASSESQKAVPEPKSLATSPVDKNAPAPAAAAGSAAALGVAAENSKSLGANVGSLGASNGPSNGPSSTHKEVRELQPHIYAPHSADTSGPTQARINPATRNSMLQSKRRSVLLPSSPIKEGQYEGGESLGGLNVAHPQPTQPAGPSASQSHNLASVSENHASKPPTDREAAKSYVSEDADSDDKFASAVDLSERRKLEQAAKDQPPSMPGSFPESPSEKSEEESRGGLRRSHPHTNLSLQSIDSAEINNSADISHSDMSTNIIGLSNEMSVPPKSSGPAGQAAANAKSAADRDVSRESHLPTSESALSAQAAALALHERPEPAGTKSLLPSEAAAAALHERHDQPAAEKSHLSSQAAAAALHERPEPAAEKSHLSSQAAAAALHERPEPAAEKSPLSSQAAAAALHERPEPAAEKSRLPAQAATAALHHDSSLQHERSLDHSLPRDDSLNQDKVPKYTSSPKRETSTSSSELPEEPSTLDHAGAPGHGGPGLGSGPSGTGFSSGPSGTGFSGTGLSGSGAYGSGPSGSGPSSSGPYGSNGSSGSSGHNDPSSSGHNDPSSRGLSSGAAAGSTGPATLKEPVNRSVSNGADSLTIGASPAEQASEIATLRKQLDAYRQRDFDDEHHKLRLADTQRQRELADLRDNSAQLNRKHAVVTSQNSDLKLRCEQLEKQMGGHIAALATQQRALDEATQKLRSQEEELSQSVLLKSENADLKLQLQNAEAARKHAEEQLEAVNNSYASLKSAHSDLSARHLAQGGPSNENKAAGEGTHAELKSQVSQLNALWAQYTAGAAGAGAASNGTRDLNATGPADGSDYRSLYEEQKAAAEHAHSELQSVLREQQSLKAQLRELSAIQAASPSSADLNKLKEQHRSAVQELEQAHSSKLRELEQAHASKQQELEQAHSAKQRDLEGRHDSAIKDLGNRHALSIQELGSRHESTVKELEARHESTLKELKAQSANIEDLRARLKQLEASYAELQGEYNKALDLSRNQQVALTKTREELNMSRAHAQRLEEQLEDATLHTSSQANNDGSMLAGDVSHNSINSSRNDQAALVIRDLRAQVVILEEEMQNQRDQIMRLKKAALTK